MTQALITGLLLIGALLSVTACLVGTFGGGFREVEPRAEDEVLVARARKTTS